MRTTFFALILALFAPTRLFAQPLADQIPDDAEIYYAWTGTQSPGPGYDQSHLKAVLDASQIGQFFQDSIPRILQQIGTQNHNGAPILRALTGVLMSFAEYPTALYVGGLTSIQPGGPPLPKIAILCDGGPDSPKIGTQIRRLLRSLNNPPLTLHMNGTVIVLSDFVLPAAPPQPLSQNKDFLAAMAPLDKNPSVALYVNGPALVSTIDALINQLAPPQAQQMWPQLRDALGLPGLNSIAATAGFSGKNWSVQAAINAPAPRKGLLALGGTEPLSDDLLKLLPVSATIAGAFTCDLSALFTQLDQAITQFSPDQGNQFHQGLSQVNQLLGFDLQRDFLAALGTQWAYYADPLSSGDGPLGFTLLSRLRNADQFQTSMSQLENAVNGFAAQFKNNNNGPRLTIQFRQSVIDGATVHYLAVPLVSPCWTIKDGTLYAALYPQVLDAAYNRPADAQSLSTNSAFQATMRSLQAPSQFTSFSFVDLPFTMPGSYQTWLMLTRLYFGLGDLAGMQTPPMILPPLPKLLAESEPAGAVGWWDDAGYHLKAIEPFPGATAIGSAQGIASGGIGETALITSILLPSLNRARETANRVKCASNLRMIGQAILLYRNDTKGAYPPDLGTLIKTEDITAQAFVCPDTNTTPPPNMTPDDAADWVNKNSDYIYIPPVAGQMPGPTIVICYEKDGNHNGDGMNVLFADGHVEFCQLPLAHKYINDTTAPK
jgi:prepilin-type processing-associated H-X9-DG protein